MKFFGMVAMLALVSTVAFADDHAASHDAAAAANKAGTEMQKAGEHAEANTMGGSEKMAKAGKKAHKKADKMGADMKKDAAKEAAKADKGE